jgi:rubrerythrin
MSRLATEPFIRIGSLEELFAVAAAMEREAIAGYSELARRMDEEGRPELAEVFERLVAEETSHLDNVGIWSQRMTGREPDLSALRAEPDATFDDEGAGTVAPELVDAYRAFSIAVRNEERAFAFWTYVAAQSTLPELQKAAEQMAREELDHVARLRPTAELLLDCYLDLGERLPSQAGRDRAQTYAAELLDCVSLVRELAQMPG